MHPRTPITWLALATLGASVLVSCGGDDEGYPPFEMTYTLGAPGESVETWQLEYRAADDWTKTLVATEGPRPFEIGTTARWDGDRIEWASTPEGPFVRDQAPYSSPVHAFPERWFANDLDELPNEVWVEIDAPRDGTRRVRNEFPMCDDAAVEILTFDVETGLPLEYEIRGTNVLNERFEVVELAFQ